MQGLHFEPGPKCVLIQIADPAQGFPTPKYNFARVWQFEFLDAESGFDEDFLFSDEQAVIIRDILTDALSSETNVLVHCTAGLCRSGAIAEVGVMMGFQDPEVIRMPNIRVKHKLMRALGWTYDAEEKPKVTSGGIIVPDNFEEF